jgi:hypothetical protein
VIAKYIKLFGGGAGAPLIKYLDAFSKAFGENLKLGREFIETCTETSFHSNEKLFVHVRTGLLAANLISPKVVDGIARLLVKSDVEKLKNTSMKAKLDSCEDLLSAAWNKITVSQAASSVAGHRDHCYATYGRFSIRCILHLVSKEKQGREKKEYANLDAIKLLFDIELATPVPAAHMQQAKVQRAASSSESVSLQSTADPQWIAAQRGYVCGSYYTSKGQLEAWLLKSVTSDGALSLRCISALVLLLWL